MPLPITDTAGGLDLSLRVVRSSTVVASPAAAAETTICTITVTGDIVVNQAVGLEGWAAYTVGTNGVSGQLRLRQTSSAGTLIADSGAVTRTAAQLVEQSVFGQDTAAVLPGQVYVLTLQVASGSAASTVSAVYLRAFVV